MCPFLDDNHSLEVGPFSLEDNPEVPLLCKLPLLHMFCNYKSKHDVVDGKCNCFQGNMIKDCMISQTELLMFLQDSDEDCLQQS